MISLRSSYLFLLFCAVTRSELFTAVVDLEKLLYTEGEIVKTLEKYLDIEEQRLQKVRWLRGEYQKLYNEANEDVQTFLSNPVNAYLLVKRLTADWKLAERLVEGADSKALIENITYFRHELKFPDEEDLSGAAAALMRLQDTYKLDTATLAKGQIQGTKPSPELTAGDCYELGKQAHNIEDYYHALLWMQEALDRIDEETNKTADKVEILEYIAYSEYMQGNLTHALKLTNNILELDPNHPRAQGNRKFYSDALALMEIRKQGDDDVPLEPTIHIPDTADAYEYSQWDTYEKLCRGEQVKSNADETQLRCRFHTNNSPVLLLQPSKEEVLNLKPRIVVYHDVLSDNEIAVIKQLAQPKLQRAKIIDAKSGTPKTASYRISKSAWLKDEVHAVIRRVSQRIEAVTGLTLSTAEDLQVVNYGIGGHYEPHLDFATRKEIEDGFSGFDSMRGGNRIATWLNYMSDVEAGGATVFPRIGVSVKPKKGSAAFWYNLFKNGEGDELTLHAACPVLAGSKWVSNKWIHEIGQEFRRKCGLNSEE